MVCSSFLDWVMRTISSLSTVPSLFQSGTSWQKPREGRVWRALRQARCEKTRASSRELDAKRLAPCSPVEAHSPEAYRLRMEVAPHSSVCMPPQE